VTRVVSFEDWLRLDAIEQKRGEGTRPRIKFTSIEDMLAALAEEAAGA